MGCPQSIFLLLRCLYGLSLEFVRAAGLPRALLHIGAPKAGNTRLQSIVSSPKVLKLMAAENMYWPFLPEHGAIHLKGCADLALGMRFNKVFNQFTNLSQPRTQFEQFLNVSRHHKRDVFLSAENFSPLLPQVATELRDVLLKGFNVTVVIVFREWISHHLSFYFDYARRSFATSDFAHPASNALSSYLMMTGDYTNEDENTAGTIAVAVKTFGANNVRIVDLDGADAAKKELAYVLLCDIMGILCGQEESFGKSTSFRYEKRSIVGNQLYSMLHDYVMIQSSGGKCTFCQGKAMHEIHGISEQAYKDKVASAGTGPNLPVTLSHLKLLIPYSYMVDAKIRSEYGPLILYGNATASHDVARSHIIEELDEEAVWKDPTYEKWLFDQFFEAIEKKIICCQLIPERARHRLRKR